MLDASTAPNAVVSPDAAGGTDTASNQTKPADAPITRQAKNGQPSASNTGADAAAATAGAAAAIVPAMTVDLALLVQAAPTAAAAAAAPADAKQTSGDGDKAAASPGVAKTDSKTAESGDDATVAVSAGTMTDAAAFAAAPPAVAVAMPVIAIPSVPPTATPANAPAKPASDTTAGPAPVEPQGAPALAAEGAAPDTPDQIAAAPGDASIPAAGETNVAPAKPQQKADGTTADTDGASMAKVQPKVSTAAADAVKAAPDEPDNAAIETESLPAHAEAKSPARPERKTEAKAKSGQQGEAPATQTRPSSDGARAAIAPAEQDADGKAPTARQSHAQPAEHAPQSARLAPAEARGDATAIPVAAEPQPSTASANLSSLALNLAAPVSSALPALSPLTALRVDQPDNNPVPVAGLAVEIVSRAQDGSRRFEIRLDPPELGRIDVRLDVDSSGNVTSRLTVERADTLDLLRRDAPQLERALQHAGLNTEGGLQFSLRDQTFANREQMPRDAAPTHLIVPDDEPAAADAARRGYGRLIGLGGGVDIRV
jgi:flagellar hook-length control protein FliK